MSTKKTNHNIFCTINPKKAIVNTTVGQKNCKKKDNQKQKNTHFVELPLEHSGMIDDRFFGPNISLSVHFLQSRLTTTVQWTCGNWETQNRQMACVS